MSKPWYNEAIYEELPPAEARYQLAHINESRAKDINVSHFVCLAIAVVAIALRFLSRRMSKTPLKMDDWMIVAALVFALGYIISVLLCIMRYGGGRHAILLNDPVKFAQSVLAAEVFYPPAIACVKISTLFLFTRIFPSRGFRILLYTVGTFVATYSGVMVITAIFQCRPMQAAWDLSVKGQCIKINLAWMIMAGLNVLTDIILLVAPLPTLWKLQMPGGTKLQLMGIFCIGGFVCIVSIYRIPKLYGLSLVDASWSNADPTIWSLVEVCVAIACACAIVYRPLVNWLFRIRISVIDPKEASSSSQSRSRSRPKINVGGYSGSRDDWNTSGRKGGLLKMDKIKVFGKPRGDSVAKESAVRSEKRSSFQQLKGEDDGKGARDERREVTEV